MKTKIILSFIAAAIFASSPLHAQKLPAGVTEKIDRLVEAQLQDKAFPGAELVVGGREGILYSRNYGYLDYSGKNPVTDSTLYDLASCTKVLSTTFALMYLYDNGKLKLEEKLGDIVPRFKGTAISGIAVKELLTHTSGIGNNVVYPYFVKNAQSGKSLFSSRPVEGYPYCVEPGLYMAREVTVQDFCAPRADTILDFLSVKAFSPARRGKYLYADPNFYLLRLVAEEKSGMRLDALTRELMDKMSCTRAGYNPLHWYRAENIAPTEHDYLLRRGLLCGTPHDEFAAVAGGVGGNAGLFATASDVARFCEMLLGGGTFQGRQILKASTVALFTSSPLSGSGIYRGYGFDKRGSGSLGGSDRFGHTGFTGTIFWIDKTKGVYIVFLSNSVHPSRTNKKLNDSGLRRLIWETVIGS